MVPLIEDQIHEHFKDLEEARCRALEAENQSKGISKRVERREIPKPWKRLGDGLCQAEELVALVSQYDYDLAEKAFQEYCARRGRLHVAGEPGSRRWDYFATHTLSRNDYLADPYSHFAEPPAQGERYRYSERERESGWQVILLGRAALQDCWELYRGTGNDEASRP